MKFSSLKTDSTKETSGVWITYGEDCKVLIARANNSKFREEVQRASRPHQIQIKTGLLDPKIAEDIMRNAAAKYILLGWQGLEDDNSQPIVYSSTKAREMFEESSDFFTTIMELASNASLFKADDLGNSNRL